MCFVGGAELDLHLVPSQRLWIAEQKVEPARPRLASFDVLDEEISQAQHARVLSDQALQPLLILSGVRLEADRPGLTVFHSC